MSCNKAGTPVSLMDLISIYHLQFDRMYNLRFLLFCSLYLFTDFFVRCDLNFLFLAMINVYVVEHLRSQVKFFGLIALH